MQVSNIHFIKIGQVGALIRSAVRAYSLSSSERQSLHSEDSVCVIMQSYDLVINVQEVGTSVREQLFANSCSRRLGYPDTAKTSTLNHKRFRRSQA